MAATDLMEILSLSIVCTTCNSVYDLNIEPLDHINVIAGANFAGKIEGHTTLFYGTCEHCITKH